MLKIFLRSLCGLFLLTVLSLVWAGQPRWTLLPVPGAWEDVSGGRYAKYDGIAWYRCVVKVPASWRGDDLALTVHHIDNCHQAFFNGVKIGEAGSFPPAYRNGLSTRPVSYTIPAKQVRPGAENVIAIRICDHDGRGGFKGAAPFLSNDAQAIALKGDWLFRTGDDLAWAKLAEHPAGVAVFGKVEETAAISKRFFPQQSEAGPLSPAEALKQFVVPDDLQLELVLAEPVVRQPVFFHFDERGRMWVVQYLQYPNPAGLKLLSRDKYWRNVYDKLPPPPPHHFPGKDKITIHEDTDGDGIFDRHKTFVEGLNIATAVERGRGGVWVLNPPYLLFYPDRDNDDVPDGPPEVHLQGFGLEDTHSVVNSLRWGPDGWLYAAQGSTVSAKVQRPGSKEPPTASMGQLIWRYHPETHRYEMFAEGGGNAFGVEIDSQGRIFSGHNGGNTRGFHYVQGGYYQKGFSKHGAISNPFAFGYFPPMRHPNVPRFTHTFAIYEGANLPARYQGKLFGAAPLLNHVVCSDVLPDGSSFQTRDVEQTVKTSDPWFRPVDIKIGPDGALYIADWYDGQINHYRNHEGQLDAGNGRIYRLKTKGTKAHKPPDLAQKSSRELVALLQSDNRWTRQTVLRLLADRKEKSLLPLLREQIEASKGQLALESLWALHLCGGLDEAAALKALEHTNPFVRLWTVRLLGDRGSVSTEIADRLTRLAQTEPNIEVRSQLACTARRLPPASALAIVRQLLQRKEDRSDIHIPLLLWWALEAQAEANRDELVQMFAEQSLWAQPLVEQHILERLMRRYAQAGTRKDLLTCARLLQLAPTDAAAKILLTGFERAYAGRSLARLPEELVQEMARRGGGSVSLRLRLGEEKAFAEALQISGDEKADPNTRRNLVQILGEIRNPRCVPVLLRIVEQARDEPLRQSALTALQAFDEASIAREVIALHDQLPLTLRRAAQGVLLSRKSWTKDLLQAVERGQLNKDTISLDVVRQMTIHADPQITALVRKHWGQVQGATTAQMQQKIAHWQQVIPQGIGSPYEGKKLFKSTCFQCHTLFTHGGKVGPDLTTYKRDDLGNMLLHIVNPSAEIREGYEQHLLITTDGRALTGFLVEQDNQLVVLRNASGEDISVPKRDIEESRILPQSLMPEGQLDNLTDQQVRDLFAYLCSSQPLNE